jgi:predicted AAA+ superfamily ATPase
MATRRVVLLAGPRQCGKTTLAKQINTAKETYLTLDDRALKEAAQTDPQSFVQHRSQTLIIDEIQRVPDLLPAIKKVVDEDMRPGQYLLTGSAHIQTLPHSQESLAGRMTTVRLRPLAWGEIKGTLPHFLDYAFAGNFEFQCRSEGKESLIGMALRGGFPEALTLEDRDRRKWYQDYIEALLSRDLRDLTKINRYDAMLALTQILAAWSSKLMDVTAISSGLSIHQPTVTSYMNALEALYLVEKVRPWTKTDYGRVGKRPKLFITDSGLMAGILSWKSEQILLDADRLGKLMETFVFCELLAQIDASSGFYEISHYRDREGREIDFLVENEEQAILGVEVKSSSSVQKKDFKHLQWFQENLAKNRPFKGIVFYTGERTLSFGKSLWAVPISMLWPQP